MLGISRQQIETLNTFIIIDLLRFTIVNYF